MNSREGQKSGQARHLAQFRGRLIDPNTQAFLHLSGSGTTKDGTWSWSGNRSQADALRKRAIKAGQEWPFIFTRDDEEDAAA